MRKSLLSRGVLFLVLATAGLSSICAAADAPSNVAELRRSFQSPPDEARINMRWWWFGPSVTKPELEREMRVMKAGGIGGFEVQPVYAIELDNPAKGFRNFKYLSDEFLDDLRFTGEKARELGLRMDLTLGSGWPFGGPHIPITEAAGKLRMDRVPVPANATSVPMPAIGEGEKFIAAFLTKFPANGDRRLFMAEGIRRLTDFDATAVKVPAEPGEGREVLFFIASRTKQTVKRPAVGAEGWVLDHYDMAAIQTHLKLVGEPMLKALAKTPPYSVFSDSLEVYGSDFTGDFLAEFQKRRGYDLTPYLPVLAGDTDTNGQTGAIRNDWGQTLTELCEERYLKPLTAWAHQHGTKFRSQTYGIPPVTLSSYRLVDLPEGEGTQWREFSTTRWATSASHLYGRPVTSSETWTWLHSPVFRATPLDMKAEADLHFLQGVNQLVGHGWPYSPPEAGEPGWRFYAAAVFNDHNPWYLVMPDIAKYLQRVSYLLRQGQPANDVAIYLPTHDAYAGFTLGRDSVNQSMPTLLGPNLIPQILDAGYGFDFIDDDFINNNAAIASQGISHPILILPGVQRIPLATYRRIAEFMRRGGNVVAIRRLPSLAPGLIEAETDTPQIQELSRTAFQARLLVDESKLGETLHAALAADVTTPPEIGVVHRKLAFGELYFLANTSNHPVSTSAVFRVGETEAAWWDPVTGKVSKAELLGWLGKAPRVQLNLAPYESRVIVFSKDKVPARPAGGLETRSPELTGGWRVTVDGSTKMMPKVKSWTDDEATRFYSGQATYEKMVVANSMLFQTGSPIYLTFGEGTAVTPGSERRPASGMRAMLESPVREAAVVYVNGQRAGAVWCPPYEVDVTGLLKAGENDVRVVVANLAVNVLAKGPLPDYKELTAKYGEKFQAQDMNLVEAQPSGLLGPVWLVSR
ncbi:MAG TPA: glycosyl hydrolase [Candidatus Acidoferrales bacterium]|nr:glycosyl hydrolase [Candidatus Acidoferrales bacterium]